MNQEEIDALVYGHESEESKPEVPKKTNKRPRRIVKRMVIGVSVLLLLIAAGTGGLVLYKSRNNTTLAVPANLLALKTIVSFPILYPSQLPETYRFDDSKLSSTNDVVIYAISYVGDRLLTFSIQPKPSADTVSGLTGQLKDRKLITFSEGEASYGLYGPKSMIIVTTDKTLAIIQASDVADEADLNTIVKSLRPI